MDEERVGYVMENLLGNALKYTPEKGSITVKAAFIKDKNSYILVSVSDTGPGITRENQEKVFDKFKRVGDRYETPRGTGLGLSIAKAALSFLHCRFHNDSSAYSFVRPGSKKDPGGIPFPEGG